MERAGRKETAREKGRSMACEGIIRSRFGQRSTQSGNKAIASIKSLESGKATILFVPRRWLVSAAAVAATAVLAIMLGWQPYPEFEVSGGFVTTDGKPVGRGSTLVTAKEEAVLVLGGYCNANVKPGSQVRIEGKKRDECIVLEKGSVACAVDREYGKFRIDTELATVQVTGTRFDVLYRPGASDEAEMVVRVEEGSVLVWKGDQRRVLKANDELVLTNNYWKLRKTLTLRDIEIKVRMREARRLWQDRNSWMWKVVVSKINKGELPGSGQRKWKVILLLLPEDNVDNATMAAQTARFEKVMSDRVEAGLPQENAEELKAVWYSILKLRRYRQGGQRPPITAHVYSFVRNAMKDHVRKGSLTEAEVRVYLKAVREKKVDEGRAWKNLKLY